MLVLGYAGDVAVLGGGRSAGRDAQPGGGAHGAVRGIAAEDSAGACRLFAAGGAAVFAQNHQAPDCATATSSPPRSPTREHFAAAKLNPSGEYPGVVVAGDSAQFGDTCSGWDGPDVTSGLSPSDLGGFTLRKTGTGRLISDNDTLDTFDTCGG